MYIYTHMCIHVYIYIYSMCMYNVYQSQSCWDWSAALHFPEFDPHVVMWLMILGAARLLWRGMQCFQLVVCVCWRVSSLENQMLTASTSPSSMRMSPSSPLAGGGGQRCHDWAEMLRLKQRTRMISLMAYDKLSTVRYKLMKERAPFARTLCVSSRGALRPWPCLVSGSHRWERYPRRRGSPPEGYSCRTSARDAWDLRKKISRMPLRLAKKDSRNKKWR